MGLDKIVSYKEFLTTKLKFKYDPFSTPVAEEEIQQRDNNLPRLYSYFTKSTYQKVEQLYEARNGFVFGIPGSGKTTLRFALTRQLRRQVNTLAITYEQESRYSPPPNDEQHWRNIAYELAIDLFIYILEHIGLERKPVTETQKQALTNQMALIWRHKNLNRIVASILEETYTKGENGIATLWTRLGRYPIRYVPSTERIKELLEACQPNQDNLLLDNVPGDILLRKGIQAAKIWGIENLYVLVDGVDANSRDLTYMQKLIAPLLINLARWQEEKTFFYFFLTPDLRDFTETFQRRWIGLTYPPIFDNIEWTAETLENILLQRLVVAGAGRVTFEGSDVNVEQFLVNVASKSPRKLMALTRELIQTRAFNGNKSDGFSKADLQQMRQMWNQTYDEPLPPLLQVMIMPPENFDPNQFIERPDVMEQLRLWVSDAHSRMLRVLTAPPGYGKTWVAGALMDDIPDGYVPVYVSAQQFGLENEIHKWLDSLLDPHECAEEWWSDDWVSKLSALMQCLINDGMRPLLIIDDVLAPTDFPDTSLFPKFLQQIPSVPNKDNRVLLIGRNPKLSSLWQNIEASDSGTLQAFSTETGKRQLTQLGLSEEQINDLSALIEPYAWRVPHLTKCFAEAYLDNNLNLSSLWQCAVKVYGDADFLKQYKETLIVLSNFKSFTAGTMQKALATGGDETRHILDALFNVQLVEYISRKYRVVDGWREFFQALKQMEGRNNGTRNN